jgi:acyl carrier protein
MYEVLKTIMVEDLLLDADEVRPDASREDAGLDSLAVVELSMALNRRFGIQITDEELLELDTVADIVRLMGQRTGAT